MMRFSLVPKYDRLSWYRMWDARDVRAACVMLLNSLPFRSMPQCKEDERKTLKPFLDKDFSVSLPDLDSNQDKQNQNLSYYHYTIGQPCHQFPDGGAKIRDDSFSPKTFTRIVYSLAA